MTGGQDEAVVGSEGTYYRGNELAATRSASTLVWLCGLEPNISRGSLLKFCGFTVVVKEQLVAVMAMEGMVTHLSVPCVISLVLLPILSRGP